MPKSKAHSGAKKRLRTTGSGKVMCERAGTRHLLEHRPSRKTHRLATNQVPGAADVKRVKHMLGI